MSDEYDYGYDDGYSWGYDAGQETLASSVTPAFKNLLAHAKIYASEDGIWPTIIQQAEDAIQTLEEV